MKVERAEPAIPPYVITLEPVEAAYLRALLAHVNSEMDPASAFYTALWEKLRDAHVMPAQVSFNQQIKVMKVEKVEKDIE